MKILIVDSRPPISRRFSKELLSHVTIAYGDFSRREMSSYRIIFKHRNDSFDYDFGPLKKEITFIEFSGGAGLLKNSILSDTDGYKFKATIESHHQIENVLRIKDKTEVTKEDIEMILNQDAQLEDLLVAFASMDPCNASSSEYAQAKVALDDYIEKKFEKR